MRSGSSLLYFDKFGCGLFHEYYFRIVSFLFVSHEVKNVVSISVFSDDPSCSKCPLSFH